MNFTEFDVYIFDVNGVLINSNLANAGAMAKAFTEDVTLQLQISDLYLKLTGIDRGSKIRRIQHELIQRPFGDGEFEIRWNRFRQLSGEAMLTVPQTAGCRQLLDELGRCHRTRVALSNTPIEELGKCLSAHGLDNRLDIVRGGGDWSKTESLVRLMDEFHFASLKCVLIGDGKGDLNAARHSNIPFVGIDPDTGEFDGETGFYGPYKSLTQWAKEAFDIRVPE
ncbi:MAG: HAD hydrolase-like protein [Desulfobacterales bacterium]|nr:HAD hydrolase-like protein [Desulfobacterales bacterium]MDD4072665.1 HAD hydrolase-like protein [Desulfobacterales bacterium]MDD4391774.1 HAD hydrolase-like protein [Desulfobacterales bacterium]